MADDVTFTVAADATPPGGTVAATDETTSGPHSVGSHMGVAKLAVSANGDSTHVPATAAGGLLVEVSNAGAITFGGLTDAELRATPVPVDVDAPVGQAAMAASIPVVIASNQSAVAVTAAAQPGVDIGDVTVNNAAGAAAVNVQDGGNSLTVDGSVSLAAAIPAGTNNIGDVDIASSVLPTGAATLAEQQTQTASLSVLDDWDETDRAKVNPIVGQAGVAAGTGVDGATVQRVSLATNVPLPAGTNNIGDVDVLSLPSIPAGTNNIGDVDVLTMPVTEVVGDVAADAAVPANPLSTGGRASTALPTAVSADGDSVYQWLQRTGAAVTALLPHLGTFAADPYTLTAVTAQYTTTQTSTVLINPGATQRIAVTSIQIQAGGTTAGALQVYFGTGAYSRGTSLAIFDGEFAPSATLKPGFALAPSRPWVSAAADDDLRVTTSAAINPITVTVWYYLIG